MKIILLGDVSFNGDLARRAPGEWDLVPKEIEGELSGVDLAYLNLESPVEGDGRENPLKSPRLRTTADALDNLAGFRRLVVSLANNHVYDGLVTGWRNTRDGLLHRGIASLGAGESVDAATSPVVMDLDGHRVGLIAAVDDRTHPCIPENAGFFVNRLDHHILARQISKLKASVNYCIVYLHWGIDYFDFPDLSQVQIARGLIEAGADVVFGSHAHVVQGWERYAGGYIFYGLGNVCFGGGGSVALRKRNRRFIVPILEFNGTVVTLLKLWFAERTRDGMQARILSGPEAECPKALCAPFSRDLGSYAKWLKRRMILHNTVLRPYEFFFNDQRSLFRQVGRIRRSHFRKIFDGLRCQ